MPDKMIDDLDALRIWNEDRSYWEDQTVGERIRSIGRTISEGEAMTFAALIQDLHPLSADAVHAARDERFGQRIVPGAMVFAYGLGLMTQFNRNSFTYGYNKIRFPAPTFIGDTICTVRTILDKQERDERTGLVTVSYQTAKVDTGEVVMYCEHVKIVARRPASSA